MRRLHRPGIGVGLRVESGARRGVDQQAQDTATPQFDGQHQATRPATEGEADHVHRVRLYEGLDLQMAGGREHVGDRLCRVHHQITTGGLGGGQVVRPRDHEAQRFSSAVARSYRPWQNL